MFDLSQLLLLLIVFMLLCLEWTELSFILFSPLSEPGLPGRDTVLKMFLYIVIK